MIDLTKLKIEAECGSPSISFNNLTKLRQIHGDIIAIIHCIDPSQNHSTQFIYYDGYTHESDGFKIAIPENDVDHQKLLTLLLMIQAIPCLAPSAERILQEYLHLEKKENKTYYLVFRVGLSYMPASNIYSDCDGIRTLDEMISFIFEDVDSVVEENEQ
jgi:hypothetical protein